MGFLLEPSWWTDFLATGLRLSVPLAFAALAGVLSERSGVFNIGLEGMMLAGAFGAALGASHFGNPLLGVLVGIAMGLLIALVLAVLSVSVGVNQIVSGVALNLLVGGLTAFLSRSLISQQVSTTILPGFGPIAIPFLSSIPVIGPVFFGQDVLVYVLYISVLAIGLVIYQTPWGLSVRATGHDPLASEAAGIGVKRVRYICLLCGGVLASLGGCHIVLSQVHVFTENISAGRGFIALAAVIFGRWHPIGVFLACLLFGFLDAVQLRLQFANPDVPYQIFAMLPYVGSILVLAGLVGRIVPPASLGLPYRREGR